MRNDIDDCYVCRTSRGVSIIIDTAIDGPGHCDIRICRHCADRLSGSVIDVADDVATFAWLVRERRDRERAAVKRARREARNAAATIHR